MQPENLRLSLALEESLLQGVSSSAPGSPPPPNSDQRLEEWRAQYFAAAQQVLSLPPPPVLGASPDTNLSSVWATGLRAAAESLIAGENLLGRVSVTEPENHQTNGNEGEGEE